MSSTSSSLSSESFEMVDKPKEVAELSEESVTGPTGEGEQGQLTQRQIKLREFLQTLSLQQQEQLLELFKGDGDLMLDFEFSRLREKEQEQMQKEYQEFCPAEIIDPDWFKYTTIENSRTITKAMTRLQQDLVKWAFHYYPELDGLAEKQLVEMTGLSYSFLSQCLWKLKVAEKIRRNIKSNIYAGKPSKKSESPAPAVGPVKTDLVKSESPAPAKVPAKNDLIGDNILKEPEAYRKVVLEYLRFAINCNDMDLEMKIAKILLPENEDNEFKANAVIDACADTILKPVTELSALTFYSCGEKLKSPKIMNACFDIIKKNKKTIWPNKEDFLESCKELPDLMYKLVLLENN